MAKTPIGVHLIGDAPQLNEDRAALARADARVVVLNPASLNLRPAAVTGVLALGAGALFLAGLLGELSKYLLGHGYVKGLVPLFDLSAEKNVPAFYSVLLLLVASSLLLVIAVLEHRSRGRDWVRWAVLGFGFAFLAYDEAFSVHEQLTPPAQALLGTRNLGVLYYTWVVPALFGLALLVPLFVGFVLRLPDKVRPMVILAGIVYVSAAVGLELVEGYWAELHGSNNLTYQLLTVLEEGLEMAGVIIFIRALLGYLGQAHQRVTFAFGDQG